MDERAKQHTDDSQCPWRASLRALGGKWKGLILWRLSEASLRFGELKRLVEGITDKMLTEQLRELEADGLISRQDFGEVPPRVLYSLTEYGRTALPAVFAMTRWVASTWRGCRRNDLAITWQLFGRTSVMVNDRLVMMPLRAFSDQEDRPCPRPNSTSLPRCSQAV